jgi:hypothetical protein
MSSRTLTFIGFGVIVGVAAVWQVVAIVGPRRATIGQVQRWLMRSLGFRIALFAFWAWLGLHLFARGSG